MFGIHFTRTIEAAIAPAPEGLPQQAMVRTRNRRTSFRSGRAYLSEEPMAGSRWDCRRAFTAISLPMPRFWAVKSDSRRPIRFASSFRC